MSRFPKEYELMPKNRQRGDGFATAYMMAKGSEYISRFSCKNCGFPFTSFSKRQPEAGHFCLECFYITPATPDELAYKPPLSLSQRIIRNIKHHANRKGIIGA